MLEYISFLPANLLFTNVGCVCVCLGEVGSGKTTLVAKLQGVEEYMKGRGLEYLYFSVHDDDIDGKQPPVTVFFFSLFSVF